MAYAAPGATPDQAWTSHIAVIKQAGTDPRRAVQVNARCIMFSNATYERSKRNRSSQTFKGKGGKGKGTYTGDKGKGKGKRVVMISNGSDTRQQRASDRRSVVKEKMLSTVLPKIADLSIDGSDTLFEVLSQGAKLSQADVKKYLGKPVV